MIKPLSAGDICIVVNGLGKIKSPNIGKFVTIVNRIYGDQGRDHRLYGAIYTCIGEDLVQLDDSGNYVKSTTADFAGIWLKRVEPEKLTKELSQFLEA